MPKAEARLNVGYVPNVHDIASCAACGASNRDPKTDIFDVRADRNHVRLCRSCLEDLISLSDQAMKFTDSPGNWKNALCRDILKSGEPDGSRLSRLDLLLESIPDPVNYACLRAHYSHERPCDQPLRAQDAGARIGSIMACDVQVIAQGALDFLRHPARAEFLRTGKSDIDAMFRPVDARRLAAAHIYVAADIAARGDAYVLRIPGMTLELAALCAAASKTGGTN